MAEQWGCDGPVAQPVFVTSCSACAGGNPDCAKCGGKGEVPHYRCPGRLLEEAGALGGEAAAAFRVWQQYDARNALPVAGGLLDQAAPFVAACEVLDFERGWHRSREEEPTP